MSLRAAQLLWVGCALAACVGGAGDRTDSGRDVADVTDRDDAVTDVSFDLGALPDGASDRDHDGVSDARDNCPTVANRDQRDTNLDGQGDACECLGVVCAAPAGCVRAIACDSTDGHCASVLHADLTPCDDHDRCTLGDVCRSGVCVGQAARCVASDRCHAAGTCDPATGACVAAALPDGASCDDGDRCNGADVCRGGVCRSGAPLHCDDHDPCTTDRCDAGSGCVHVAAPDGTPCSDRDLCNGDEQCRAGRCAAGAPATCDDRNECTADRCDPTLGCTHALDTRVCLAAPTDVRLAHAAWSSAGTTVTIVWDPPPNNREIDGYRVESASSLEGPWTALVTLPSGSTSFTDPSISAFGQWYRVVSMGDDDGERREGVASAAVRVNAIGATGYNLYPACVPGLTWRASGSSCEGTCRCEDATCSSTVISALVRYPADLGSGPYPLVLLAHGNHGLCRRSDAPLDGCPARTEPGPVACPDGQTEVQSHAGLLYLADTLAAQGFIVASVDLRALNCVTDCIPGRARVLMEHLRRWREWNRSATGPMGGRFIGRVDTMRVGLVGHSRGGEAAAMVPERLRESPIEGVRIGSILALAPTDRTVCRAGTSCFEPLDGPRVPETPYAVWLPACDGDVTTLAGLQAYDRRLALRTAPGAQLYVLGANHNALNTAWTDVQDNGCAATSDLLDPGAQRAVLEALMASWMRSTLAPTSRPLEAFWRGDAELSHAVTALAGRAVEIRRSYASGQRQWVDDFMLPGAPSINRLAGANVFTGLSSAATCLTSSCGTAFRHESPALRLGWNTRAASARMQFGPTDVSARSVLSFRVTQVIDPLNPVGRDQDLYVRLTDRADRVAELRVSDHARVPYPYLPPRATGGGPRELLHTVRLPLSRFAAATPGFDLTGVREVAFVLPESAHATGAIDLTEVEFAQ